MPRRRAQRAIAAQHVALAEADVEQAEPVPAAGGAVEEGQRRPRGKGPAVDPAESPQDRVIDLGVERRIVHLLFVAGALG